MSGDDADPSLVAHEIDRVYRTLQERYDKAKFGMDPVGRRALGECVDVVGKLWEKWQSRASGQTTH